MLPLAFTIGAAVLFYFLVDIPEHDSVYVAWRASHIAFIAPSRAAVHAFFAAAVNGGAEVLHEPRVWPEYHETYYGAFVRDPDGNNVEAVCHGPE